MHTLLMLYTSMSCYCLSPILTLHTIYHELVVYTDLCYSGVVVVYMGETVYVYISEYMAGSYCYLCEGLLQKTFSMVC